MNYHYRLIQTMQGSRYVLHDGDEPIGAPLEQVSVCFDREDGVMHKHGSEQSVTAWFEQSREKLNRAGFPELAKHLTVVSGPFEIEELNKMLSTSGYCGLYFKDSGLR